MAPHPVDRSPARPGRSSAALALAVALTALLSACAGPSSPSKDAYVAAADGVCQSAADKIEQAEVALVEDTASAVEEGEAPPYDRRPDRWMRARILPQYAQMSGALRSLPPPDGDAAYLTDLYDDLARLVEDLRFRPGQGRDLIRADEQLGERFSTYGMEVCGTV